MLTPAAFILICTALIIGVYIFLGSKGTSQTLYDAEERGAMPDILASARLHLSEYTLRIEKPYPLVSKVDQVFELPSGELILMETKTRYRNEAYPADVVELSAQAAAIRHSKDPRVKHRTVLPYAFVRIKAPDRKPVFVRVQLLTDDQLFRLYQRYQSMHAGKVAPLPPKDRRVCPRCPQRTRCPEFRIT